RRVLGNVLDQCGEFATCRQDGLVEALFLLFDFGLVDVVVLHLQLRVREQVRTADRDAARDTDAVDGEGHVRLAPDPRPHHSLSPNFCSISCTSADSASSSSSPLVSTTTLEPLAAASIMTPMMLLAFTLRPLRASQTSLWKLPASCVSLAEARACRPSLLTISTSRCCIALARWWHVEDALDAAGHGL